MTLLCYSHITRTTTWEDPRKTLAAQVANQQQRSAELLNTPHPATSPQPQPGELILALNHTNLMITHTNKIWIAFGLTP